jgi:hypothetical protein
MPYSYIYLHLYTFILSSSMAYHPMLHPTVWKLSPPRQSFPNDHLPNMALRV